MTTHAFHEKLNPRRLVGIGAAMTLLLSATCSMAATWPTRPVSVYVPVAAGGAADALARVWGAYVSKEIGGTVVVENKPGANGSIAAAYVAKQRPDGYALLFGSTSTMSINPFTYTKLAYNPGRDFDPVTEIAVTSQILVSNPSTHIRSINELVDQAKANPGKFTYGSAGIGNSTHLNVAFLAKHFGIEMTHVPYKGAAPAMVDLVSGQVNFAADAQSGALPQIRAGKAIPLVVFGDERLPELPDVPTVAEAGVTGFPGSGWYRLMAPKGTPSHVIDRLTEATRKFWADENARKQVAELYMVGPKAFGPKPVLETMKRETRIWGPIVKSMGIRNN
ncbi:Bug family tripartite tricarboxylate transporter substrate binding protein [Advenella kashmirensis]|nr:tripartite tricarboxylate transporter substrate binding protein [Advenella kashmirensis]